ncbi:hypothetical protein G6F61_014183 [Rhizopus arrhizus]|nr:hypothetical protein G6F61_014183 [Rhizopus arrhizus]
MVIAVATSDTRRWRDGVGRAAATRRVQRGHAFDSAPPVTAVISGTSVIAKAPFMVCTARSSASLTGCGACCAERSQPCRVAWCTSTSASRISRSTLSMLAGVPTASGAASASVCTDAIASASRMRLISSSPSASVSSTGATGAAATGSGT